MDLIIHNDSCHPFEHKLSATKFLTDRVNIYPTSNENKLREHTTMKEAQKKNYETNISQPSRNPNNITKPHTLSESGQFSHT
jgi:hypothetical protein